MVDLIKIYIDNDIDYNGMLGVLGNYRLQLTGIVTCKSLTLF